MPEFKPYVSVVIATYNRAKMLGECLDALSLQTYPKSSYEVIIVNDGSRDGTEQFLGRYQKEATFSLRYYTQENAGQATAVNLGIEKANGVIVCFTDDDCLADKDWIKNLVAGYTTDDIVCVGGLITQENFMLCGPVIGANTSYRKKTLTEAGGFDPQLPIGLDGDLGIRVKLRGHKFYYAKDAVMYHKHRVTLKGVLKWQYNYGTVVRMNKKYKLYFKPFFTFIPLPAKICLNLVKIPIRVITMPYAKEKDYHVAEPVLDVLVSFYQMKGLLHETFFGKRYTGEKYPVKIDFLIEQSFSSMFNKITLKITKS